MASDMKEHAKQRYVFEFLHADRTVPIETHAPLVNVYGDEILDMSKVQRGIFVLQQCVDCALCDGPRSGHPRQTRVPTKCIIHFENNVEKVFLNFNCAPCNFCSLLVYSI